MVPISIYLHIPFCRHRCGYCDFNTYAGLEAHIPLYIEALCAEIAYLGSRLPEHLNVHTVFFGGGTPSLLGVSDIGRVIQVLAEYFSFDPLIEISLEANPGALEANYLKVLHKLGINRLSLGMQSAHPQELLFLERQHDYADVIQAVKMARQAGFDNINLDLIYGLPEQRLDTWKHTLEMALQLQPEHLSLYALTLEHGTPLGNWAERGLIPQPDPDCAADMYEWSSERLAETGFEQYEISNWARRVEGGLAMCRHNLQYWRNLPYLGFGAGAHGFVGGVRTVNVLAPLAFMKRCLESDLSTESNLDFPCTPATQSAQPVTLRDEIAETMMMGLRLTQEGVPDSVFSSRFGKSLREVFGEEIKRMISLGLLEWGGDSGDSLRLTSPGRLLGNQVFVEFLEPGSVGLN